MEKLQRRSVLLAGGVALASAASAHCSMRRAARQQTGGGPGPSAAGSTEAQEVSPTEDLMQEHGLLERVLLIYEEGARRVDRGDLDVAEALHRTAAVVQQFVHDYHEHLEETHLFPLAERASGATLPDLARLLRAQHERGRLVTASLLSAVAGGSLSDAQRPMVARTLRSFARMYRPHAAREDTVLFPAMRERFTPAAWHELGEGFEAEEHRRFGREGFEGNVERIAAIERAWGIYDLAEFTA
jgi:hemerythrin-like domain-containing protein